jgi:sec-independent protein translocase protein TatA
MPSIGPTEIIIVLALALIVFGPKRLPELGKSLGGGLRGFKDTVTRSTPTREELALEPAEEAVRAD